MGVVATLERRSPCGNMMKSVLLLTLGVGVIIASTGDDVASAPVEREEIGIARGFNQKPKCNGFGYCQPGRDMPSPTERSDDVASAPVEREESGIARGFNQKP